MKKVILFLLFISASLNASYLVDNSETGTDTNTLGGTWLKYNDEYSLTFFTPDTFPAYAGSYCRHLQWTINQGSSNPYTGVMTGLTSGWTGVDLSSYAGVRFYARGNGRYYITLATEQTRTENNHYSSAVILTSEWKLYQLPFAGFAQLWGTSQPWDPSTIYAVGFQAFGSYGMNGQMWIDDIEFYLETEAHPLPDPNIIIPEPKVNQLGYLPAENKYFCISANYVSEGDTFHIIDNSSNVLYSGIFSGMPVNDTASTGEFVWKINFSDFSIPGTYKIKTGDLESYPFNIEGDVYNKLFEDALRCFYLIRCGPAVNDPVTGLMRSACHMNDAKIRGGSGSIDATGGWHNASDKGKFVNETAISIAYMLWLYEFREEIFHDLDINIAESGNGLSDLLNEAKWGLTWLLKMQNEDGTVYHKADSEPYLYYCPDPAPDQDPYDNERYVEYQKNDEPQLPSTIDAADFAAVMSQAARVFSEIDAGFSSECFAAAEKSWNWVRVNRSTGQSDPYYIDPVPWQEYLWAKGEMARSLNSNSLRQEFSQDIDTVSLTNPGWGNPELFGYLSLYYDNQSDASLKNKIRLKIISLCNTIAAVSENTGYGVALQSWEYWWESNENVLSKADCLIFGYILTGDNIYKEAALGQLNYILGLNSLNKSFVMSHGSNPMRHPFHWIYAVYGIPVPGWTAGGPNSKPESADYLLSEVILAGTPDAKCYVDQDECGLGSWASNEGETSENAALLFLTGCLYDGLISTETEELKFNTPLEFSLYQNFPNPFNPSTNICFRIKEAGFVSLKVFDVLGGEVAVLVNEEKSAGLHKIEFNANRISTGVYFYQLKWKSQIETKKLILIR